MAVGTVERDGSARTSTTFFMLMVWWRKQEVTSNSLIKRNRQRREIWSEDGGGLRLYIKEVRETAVLTSGGRMFKQREQLVQRPWGRTVLGMLEEQGGGLCGYS